MDCGIGIEKDSKGGNIALWYEDRKLWRVIIHILKEYGKERKSKGIKEKNVNHLLSPGLNNLFILMLLML